MCDNISIFSNISKSLLFQIPDFWRLQSTQNIIEATLVRNDGQPHPYMIDNKDSKTAFDDNTLIFRQNDHKNTLYFRVTDDDFTNKSKR